MVQIRELIDNLEWFTCSHILRELNSDVDALSKDGLSYEVTSFYLQEFSENLLVEDWFFRL